VLIAARSRYPTGFESGSEEELVAVGTILLELGGDPNALVLDAAATILRDKCEPKGARSVAGRRPDNEKRWRQDLGYAAVRVFIEMSRAAWKSRALPEVARLDEMAHAAARELSRQVEGVTDGKARSAQVYADALEAARGTLASHERVARALLDRFPPGRRGSGAVEPWKHVDAAIEALQLLSPPPSKVFVPKDGRALECLRRGVAKRSTRARKRRAAIEGELRPE